MNQNWTKRRKRVKGSEKKKEGAKMIRWRIKEKRGIRREEQRKGRRKKE